MTNFGSRVRERRLELGWTQEQLAAKAGLSNGAISMIERGDRSARTATLARLAKALAVSISDLFDELEKDVVKEANAIPA